MYLTQTFIESKILLENEAQRSLSNLTNKDKIISWNGTDKFEASSFLEILPRMTTSLYEVKTANRTIILDGEHGFWLDGGDEIRVKNLIAGKSTVYTREGHTIKKVIVNSIEKIEENFLVYDIVGAENRNYVINDFILHNFDLDDYLTGRIIGKGNIETVFNSGGDWSDMGTTARATRDGWAKAAKELLGPYLNATIPWLDTALQATVLAAIQDWGTKYETFYIKFSRFWNSVEEPGAQQTGIVTAINAWVEFTGWTQNVNPYGTGIDFAQLVENTISIDVDYTGTSTFTPTLWTEYETALKDMMASFKRLMAILGDWRIPEGPYGGVVPPGGYKDFVAPGTTSAVPIAWCIGKLTQSGTNPPTLNILNSNIDLANINLQYVSNGNYQLQIQPADLPSPQIVFATGGQVAGKIVTYSCSGSDVNITTSNGGILTDGILNDTDIKIEVYDGFETNP